MHKIWENKDESNIINLSSTDEERSSKDKTIDDTKSLIWNLLAETWIITQEQLQRTITYQKVINRKWNNILFWDALTELWYITSYKLIEILEKLEIKLRVWEILLRDKSIEEYILKYTLQNLSKWKNKNQLLDELISINVITESTKNDVLNEQVNRNLSDDDFLKMFWQYLNSSEEKKDINNELSLDDLKHFKAM